MRLISLPDSSPLVTFRLVFRTGAADDPPSKAGVASLTARMLGSAGSRRRAYPQILDALFPMAAAVNVSVDKEMVAFTAETHRDNLDRFYEILRDMLLDPGWREEDFERLRDDAVNYLEVELRHQNDEELGRETLVERIFPHHPYGTNNAGTPESLARLTPADLRNFWLARFACANLTIGLAGGFPKGFDTAVQRDFAALPVRPAPPTPIPAPPPITRDSVFCIEKPSLSAAISLGFPIDVRRGHPDYPALLTAVSAFGQHRNSSGRLFTRMRQLRGLNYGDYAYIEHFPGAMFSLEPPVNAARSRQIFEIWIRPVDRAHARFALKLALFELERLIRDGLAEDEFLRARAFLSKYANLLVKTRSAELGYRIDSDFYSTPYYPAYLRGSLSTLTLDAVNAAIRRHLHTSPLHIVMIGHDLLNAPCQISYNSPMPTAIMEEDTMILSRP